MNKLEAKHKRAIQDSYYIEVYGNVDAVKEFCEGTAAKKATEITTDVAIEFANFCKYECHFYFKEYKWQIGDIRYAGKQFTDQELFDIFINDYYDNKGSDWE